MNQSQTNALLSEVLAQRDSVSQAIWTSVEDPACKAVQGLRVLQHRVILEDDVELRKPSSPIIGIDEAEELYGMVAPVTAELGLLRPLLIRLMVTNDCDNRIMQLKALWVLFDSITTFERLRLRAADKPKICNGGGQALVGGQPLYIKEYLGMKAQHINAEQLRARVEAETNSETAAQVLHRRDREPAQWSANHQPWRMVASN